ncbi:MAG: dihydrofolate reductase family protein [Verrucomicrobiae bacterium]|nr:dihydrofolate reductase family protein [Verrucomicrobiae bacterium]
MKRKNSRVWRPFVLVNMAMSADGKIATANRAVSSFGSRRDHDHLLALRATADAVMAGARTVSAHPVDLGPGPARFRRLRQRRGLAEYNLRVIVSGRGRIPPDARVFQRRFSPVIVLVTSRATRAARQRLRAAGAHVKVCGRDAVNLRAALRWLRERWGVKRLVCEGGGELNDAMFRADLVDEVHLTVCPLVFGGRAAPTIADGVGARVLPGARAFRLKSARRVENELFLVYERDLTRAPRRRPAGPAQGTPLKRIR